jgi:hypothetical protein
VPDEAVDLLVSRIYHLKFQNHAPDSDLRSVLSALGTSRLSEKTKQRFPSSETVLCTLRNTNWLLHYWHELCPVDPVQPQFGFVRGHSGGVQFAA